MEKIENASLQLHLRDEYQSAWRNYPRRVGFFTP